MRRPDGIVYWVGEKPPAWIGCLQGLQHISIYAISLVFPVLIMQSINAPREHVMFAVSMSMVGGGIGVILQSLRKGPIGSGYLVPQVCGPSFISSSMMAVQMGGLPLLLGMTMFAGTLEMFFSRLVKRLRAFFPPEVTGTIVSMVGITVVSLSVQNFVGLGGSDTTVEPTELIVGFGTLATMVILNVWTRGRLKMFSVLIGMVAGYIAGIATGIVTTEQLAELSRSQTLWLPLLHHPGWSFRWELILPFAVAMICSSLKSIGDMITAQKINDADWKRMNTTETSGGILADGAGCFLSGCVGGMGQSTSSSNIGVTIATGVTSRYVAVWMGGTLILFGFIPKISHLFAIMPHPVMGAALIFAVSFMIVAGLQIITSRMMDARKIFVVGLSLIFGLSADIVPEVYQGVPHWLQPLVSSSLSLSAVLAVILNLVFRIGIRNTATLKLSKADSSDTIFEQMNAMGKRWGARSEIMYRVMAAVDELKTLVFMLPAAPEDLDVTVVFDELKLEITGQYKGEPIVVPSFGDMGSPEDIPAPEMMAAKMLRRYPDSIDIQSAQGQTTVNICFEH